MEEEENLLEFYFDKVQDLREENSILKEKNDELVKENLGLKDRTNALTMYLSKYDSMLHELEGVLLKLGASPDILSKLRNRAVERAEHRVQA